MSGRIHPPATPAYSVRGAVGGTGSTAYSVRGSAGGFTALDALITAQAKKLDALKLSQARPSPEPLSLTGRHQGAAHEVSGRIHPPATPAYSVRGSAGGFTALDTLRLHKQGLMQSLFPSTESAE